MQVAKWGNSLAVRIPAVVVEALELKEGDQITIHVAGKREFEVGRDRRREEAIEKIRKLRRPLPPGFKFDREEANAR
jgi:antitoxin MazE